MIALAIILRLVWPTLTADAALEHATAAKAAALPDVPAELLLAVASVESGFRAGYVSRLAPGARKRTTGVWRSSRPPAHVGNLCCGVTQATARTWRECQALADPARSYAATARSLERWLGRAGGNLRRALAGYGCGMRGLRTGACRRYPERVIARMRRLVAMGGAS